MTSFSTPTNTTLKIAVDTNQFLSVFIFRGQLMKLVFDLILDNKIELYVSPALKDEVLEKLRYYGSSTQTQDDVMSFIEEKGILVTPTVKIDVCEDKDDNFNLELSETVNANFLVTRDRKLLKLKKWKGATIINPDDFLPLLRKMKLLE